MNIDLDRITSPLQLSKGSHEPGSDRGCAMNVVSYVNGDVEITDFPRCSAKPLARIVQTVNDVLADFGTHLLSPENALTALRLGFQTVGTGRTPHHMQSRWWCELTDQDIDIWYWLDGGVEVVWKYMHNQFCIDKTATVEINGQLHTYIVDAIWDAKALTEWAGKAIDLWRQMMPPTEAEPVTEAQVHNIADRLVSA